MLCEGVLLYMMLVTVFGNKLNTQRFFCFGLGWVLYFMNVAIYFHYCMLIGPAIPIVAISVGIAHRHYGTDH